MKLISPACKALFLVTVCCHGQTANAAAIVGGPAGAGTLLKLNYSNFPGAASEQGVFISTNAPNQPYANANARVLGREDFRTFCVQLNGPVYNNQTVRVAALSTITATNDPDKLLTRSAAWLFREFSQIRTMVGGLSRYKGDISGAGASSNYNSFDATDINQDPDLFKQALWSLMGWTDAEIAAIVGVVNTTAANNKYIAAVAANTAAINALQSVTGVSIGGVSIMNLVHARSGARRQDFLVFSPDSPDFLAEVPEPSSLVLFGIGIVGAFWARRRQQNRSPQIA